LAIGSWLALAPAAGFVAAIFRRARLEDEFLTQHLSGYKSYASRIRGGLFPTVQSPWLLGWTHLPPNTPIDHGAISKTGTKHGYRI